MNKKKSGKIKNATPLIVDGVHYRSKLEAYMAKLLASNNIPFEYETKIFTLLEPFEFHGDKIRAITYKPDFLVDGHIIECKGFPNDAYPLKAKMFKKLLTEQLPDVLYHVPRNNKECEGVISKILHVLREQRDKQQ